MITRPSVITHRTIQIYDWKATVLYDARPEAGTLSVVDFWASDVPQEFSVAVTAAIDLSAFAQWLGGRHVSNDVCLMTGRPTR
jgi:hypothetical protein